ncbi:hypothetical protein [Salinisphaera sp. G21_0]|uniref:hypothetical protein n=1 Tax=Salinisphaera sp. G21_0 TaxID=2821094 RepID=UPI001ADA62E3|nr:hypothetical protein [Salinisphaera sp. G21_0]MBO9482267.1 hypothetical protein [Salinisphaera sp. G21_0]
MPLLSISKLSELTGRTHRTIKARLGNMEPVIENRSHLYESKIVFPLIYDQHREQREYDLEQERARLAKEQADGKAMDNARQRKEQLDVATMENLVAGEYAFVRNRIKALPVELSARLAQSPSSTEIQEILMAAVTEVLKEVNLNEPDSMKTSEPGDSFTPSDAAE